MTYRPSTKTVLTAFVAAMAMSTVTVEAEAKPKPKTTAASASKERPKTTARAPGQRAGNTRSSATGNGTRPNTNRNQPGYINPPTANPPRKVTFKPATRSDRTAASMLRRKPSNNVVALSSTTTDRRSPQASAALAAKQRARGKPVISKTSTTALNVAAANNFPSTPAARGAVRLGAAPVGTGQASTRQWSQLAAQTAARRGLPQQRPGLFKRLGRKFKALFTSS